MRVWSRGALKFCVLALLQQAVPAVAQMEPLFTGAQTPVLPVSGNAVAARRVTPNLGALQRMSAALSVQLPEGPQAILDADRVEDRQAGDRLWVGHVRGDASSWALITVRQGVMVMTLQTGQVTYVSRPGSAGTTLERLDPSFRPECGFAGIQVPTKVPASLQSSGSGPAEIDILVMYTPSALGQAGGDPAVQAEIQHEVDLSNMILSNSRVRATFRLVWIGRTANARYDGARWDDALLFMYGDPALAQLRLQYGADLAVLWTTGSFFKAIGVAQAENVAAGPNAGAFGQITSRNYPGDLVFTHELGHLLGMGHDRAIASLFKEVSYYPFAYGHPLSGGRGTVMAYATPVPYFSNPRIKLDGELLGAVDQDDNARVGNLNAATIAAYREKTVLLTVTAPPSPPSGLTAQGFGPGTVYLSWADNGSGRTQESGFELQSSADGSSWSLLATLPPDSVEFFHSPVAAGQAKYYRIRAFNPFGASAFSNVIAITPELPPAAPGNVQVQAVSNDAFRVTWQDNSTNEWSFSVEAFYPSYFDFQTGETYEAYWQPLVLDSRDAPANSTSYVTWPTDTIFPIYVAQHPGMSWRFRVKAVNPRTGDSAYSPEVSAVLPVNGLNLQSPPAAPTALAVTRVMQKGSLASVTLTWQDNATYENTTEVERFRVDNKGVLIPEKTYTIVSSPTLDGLGSRTFTDAAFESQSHGTWVYRVRSSVSLYTDPMYPTGRSAAAEVTVTTP